MDKQKECMICGNKKANELELVQVYSTSDSEEVPSKEYICKENNGCS